MPRKVIAVGAAILMLSSCSSVGGNDGAVDVASPTTAARLGLEEDKAVAQAALLTLADFPAGWSEVPTGDETDGDAANKLAACVGRESILDVGGAKASTGDFTDPEGNVTISQQVGIAETVDEAAAQLAGLEEPGVTACIQEATRELFADLIENPPTPADSLPEGAAIGEVTFGRLNVSPVGEQLVAYRLTVPISVEAFTIDFYLDLVFVRQARSVANLQFGSPLEPYATEELDRIVALAASRLPVQ